jgi:hypothetical protein
MKAALSAVLSIWDCVRVSALLSTIGNACRGMSENSAGKVGYAAKILARLG